MPFVSYDVLLVNKVEVLNTEKHSHSIEHEFRGDFLVPMIQEIQVERTLFHLVEFQLSNRGNRELVYHHLPYQNDNLHIENRVERSYARVIHH